MINRVNGNDYYDYLKLKMPNAADKTENGEKFSLNYQYAQEEKEDEDKKDQVEEGKDTGGRQKTVMQGGVKLELSGSAQALFASEKDGSAQTGTGFLDTVRSWIAAFTQTLKDILYKIWNDPAPQGEGDMAENAESESLALHQLENLKDPEQIINLVTDNGHKTIAKNSTLLTYYDRTGKITPLSLSDQERILHGDRNVTKL